jgi:hypothetical protein
MDVIQVADTAAGVRVYKNIFANTYYGPRVTMCRRYWTEPTPTMSPLPPTPPVTPTPDTTPTLRMTGLPTATPFKTAALSGYSGLCDEQKAILDCVSSQLGGTFKSGVTRMLVSGATRTQHFSLK